MKSGYRWVSRVRWTGHSATTGRGAARLICHKPSSEAWRPTSIIPRAQRNVKGEAWQLKKLAGGARSGWVLTFLLVGSYRASETDPQTHLLGKSAKLNYLFCGERAVLG